jgi:ribosomal subunit interface protein
MQIPLQVTFRDLDGSPAIEQKVREQAAKLDRYCDHITSCRVVIAAPHHHHHKGNLYQVRIDLTAPNTELAVSRESAQHQAHEDVYVVIRDAFDAMRRQLEDYVRKQRGTTKHHEVPPHGRIRELVPAESFGVIETADGREIRFSRNSVVDSEFDQLAIGDEVRFVETEGEEAPSASTVRVVGKHHLVGR